MVLARQLEGHLQADTHAPSSDHYQAGLVKFERLFFEDEGEEQMQRQDGRGEVPWDLEEECADRVQHMMRFYR